MCETWPVSRDAACQTSAVAFAQYSVSKAAALHTVMKAPAEDKGVALVASEGGGLGGGVGSQMHV